GYVGRPDISGRKDASSRCFGILAALCKSVSSGYGLVEKGSSYIPKGRVSVSSKACSESVQFISGATGMGKKRVGSTNKIGSNRLSGESGSMDSIPAGKVFWPDNRHGKGTSDRSRKQNRRARNRGKSSGNNNRTQVGLGSMVAAATACSDRLYSSAPSSNIVRKRDFWEGRAMEEPELAVPGSKSGLV
ncbi:40930_t:CDS:2, partial [Gigaspora margarita]